MNELTQNLLRELVDYKDGELYWKVAKGRRVKIGDRTGTIQRDGYRATMVNGKLYRTHRLIFLYHHGYLPKFLDHIDGNPANNNITNLRAATFSQNQRNRKKGKFYKGKPTSSIYKGVTWDKGAKKWMVQIMINDKNKYCGYFDSEIEAAKTYDKAAIEAFGEFAKINEV